MFSAKQTVKIILDIVMAVIFALLMFGMNVGAFFHEFAGLAVCALFILHIALNLNWFKSFFKSLKNGSASSRNKILFALDVILAVFMAVAAITGVLISQTLFPGGIMLASVVFLHSAFSYATLGIMGLHIGMHLEFVLLSVKRMFGSLKEKGVKRAVASSAAVLGALAIIYCQFYSAATGSAGGNDDLITTTEYTSAYSVTQQTENGSADSGETSAYYADEAYDYSADESSDAQSTEKTTSQTASAETESAQTEEQTEEETDTKQNSSSQSSSGSQNTTTTAVAQTLNDYLGKLICTGCHNRCSLLSPRCSKGVVQAQQAEQAYYSSQS